MSKGSTKHSAKEVCATGYQTSNLNKSTIHKIRSELTKLHLIIEDSKIQTKMEINIITLLSTFDNNIKIKISIITNDILRQA